jgi:hypothetical protein
MSLATTELMQQRNEAFLRDLVAEIRIDADIEVLVKEPEATVAEMIRYHSRDAEVVLLGLATPERGQEREYAERLESLSEGLSNVFFVKNASLFVGGLITPEQEDEGPDDRDA